MSVVVALVPAAGLGLRLGARADGVPVPKALASVAGVTLLARAVEGLLESRCVDRVVVAAPSAHVEYVRTLLADVDARFPAPRNDSTSSRERHRIRVIVGGANRTASVRLALAHADDADVVLVHDAARAFTPVDIIRAIVQRIHRGDDAAVPVLEVSDTIKRVDGGDVIVGTVDREPLRAVQTPQGFRPAILRAAYERFPDAHTDDSGMVEKLGVEVRVIPGDPRSLKITTPFDLAIAEKVLSG